MYQDHTDSGVGMSDYEKSHRQSYTGSRSSILEQPLVPSIHSMFTIAQDGPRPSSNSILQELPKPLPRKFLLLRWRLTGTTYLTIIIQEIKI
jgi:hypothetical protein